eukprot:m.311371 g.311371  ORF g.311371 m.311371 type:complete len:205 (+) comp67222_c0_seq1:90-704(+)
MSSSIQSQVLTLAGSADMVTEFFSYAVQSILYSRGLYPDTAFDREQKYGISLMVTTEDTVKEFLDHILKQLRSWLLAKKVQKLVLVVKDLDGERVLERWVFDIESSKCDDDEAEADMQAIRRGIQNVLRQIFSCVAIMPVPDVDAWRMFDILIYTDQDSEKPEMWQETGPQLINNRFKEHVQFPGFTTGLHKVDAAVEYRVDML